MTDRNALNADTYFLQALPLIKQGHVLKLDAYLNAGDKDRVTPNVYYRLMDECINQCPAHAQLKCTQIVLQHATNYLTWDSCFEDAVNRQSFGAVEAIGRFCNQRQEDLQYRSRIKDAGLRAGRDNNMVRLLATLAQDSTYQDVSLIMLGTENHHSLFKEFWATDLSDQTRKVVMINFMVRNFIAPQIIDVAYDFDLVQLIVDEDTNDAHPILGQNTYVKTLHEKQQLLREVGGQGVERRGMRKL